jgi:hypothetical protein
MALGGADRLSRKGRGIVVVLVAIGIAALGLYLVYTDTQAAVQTGVRRPGLRLIGWALTAFGGLAVLGSIMGR